MWNIKYDKNLCGEKYKKYQIKICKMNLKIYKIYKLMSNDKKKYFSIGDLVLLGSILHLGIFILSKNFA